MTAEEPARPEKRRRLDRVTAACDLCKRRKVKCDGSQPCGYCTRKNCAATCAFTAAKERGQILSAGNTPHNLQFETRSGNGDRPRSRAHSESNARPSQHGHDIGTGPSLSPTVSRDDHQEDTAVPLEGRIMRDAQGKFIFIGDCAPLSFLQTVRHLISSEVDSEGFAIQASRDSMIEIARPEVPSHQALNLPTDPNGIQSILEAYSIATCGLANIFEFTELSRELKIWASGLTSHTDDAVAAVFYLVLAIGSQETNEHGGEAWFSHARDLLLKNMANSMNVATVQGFTLVTIFMLRAFQPNGAYLYFSLAARTAYAIGIHRTEVNVSFGQPITTVRDRIWKSLRVVDMLISNVLGRPPSTSDVDCTVKYTTPTESRLGPVDVLDANVQIFMIIERVVVEVYSRKRISIRIADYVSRQLKGWALQWLQPLTELAVQRDGKHSLEQSAIVGACSTLCSYYYGIMLLTRPFLIYEVYEHLGAALRRGGTQSDHRDKRKYADAALDAAASFVETLQNVIDSNCMPRRMPLIVPWLFTSALVLAVGILGRSGLAFEESCDASIRCLDYFGKQDPHARQHSLIIQSLLKITTAHVKKREVHLRLQRKQASSELFGLLPSLTIAQPHDQRDSSTPVQQSSGPDVAAPALDAASTTAPFDWTIYDADFFALPWPNENDQGLQDFLQPGTHSLDGATVADIPLFPMYDQQADDFGQ